jgi:23S rRNA (cytidine2498-2'-O)-methyltransferase
MNKVVLYCRPGFEKECAAEITDKASRLEVFGFARVKEDSGYVIFECYQQKMAKSWCANCRSAR